jgi:hypothetical protein
MDIETCGDSDCVNAKTIGELWYEKFDEIQDQSETGRVRVRFDSEWQWFDGCSSSSWEPIVLFFHGNSVTYVHEDAIKAMTDE